MPTLTLNQAAKAAKKSKATLLDAIRNGRMSAPKDDLGRYQIDPAELFRVYPPDRSETGNENLGRPQEETAETSTLRVTVNHLRELIQQIESERDNLRERLDAVVVAARTYPSLCAQSSAVVCSDSVILSFRPCSHCWPLRGPSSGAARKHLASAHSKCD